MTFIPAPFDAADVAYFALYGCIATSNNSKVRLSDCHFPGLGIEVQCTCVAFCLQSNLHDPILMACITYVYH